MLSFAIVFITCALICYTIGVWSEKIAGILKVWHLVFFWIGFIFDTLGTTLMGKISGGFEFNIHGITGIIAILLMLFHAVWATVVLLKKNQKSMKNFHKFSLLVWLIWLVPYFTGMILNMI
ncbi:HsmA family protein [Caloranaerobacter ferrireducens]|uniref:HsmA family protein n=1 Tax=Caloranaerobacter ferrireducens TaxID=1323370 RepID=UPI00084D1024|nr:HsmA family protein [Caloranaerobacter ferrireducens]